MFAAGRYIMKSTVSIGQGNLSAGPSPNAVNVRDGTNRLGVQLCARGDLTSVALRRCGRAGHEDFGG